MSRLIIALAFLATMFASREALAYPQFQLSRDATCTGCHIAPSGGGLLTENGKNVAEAIGQFGHSPELFYGKWTPPTWLTLGGDFRAIGGLFKNPFLSAGAFPMQSELYANARFLENFRLHITAGGRPAQEGNEALTRVWSREHYVMWQQNPDETTGLYVRAGRFMPVFGLRLTEHPAYTRRFGGTPLFADTYGVSASYIEAKAEVHVTGFIRDRVIDPAVHDSGGAIYGEVRVTDAISVGLESMITVSKDDQKYRGGATGKYYVAPIDLMVQGEVIFTQQQIDDTDPARFLTGHLMVSKFVTDWLLIDGAVGFHDNMKVKQDDREAFEVNVHWFVDSHLELVLNSRLEIFAFGQSADTTVGGPTGGYTLLQAHFRL